MMPNKTKETQEERLNPSLDSPWNKMAVPTLDIFEELFNETTNQQQAKEKQDGSHSATRRGDILAQAKNLLPRDTR
jgi:hypothetical protein